MKITLSKQQWEFIGKRAGWIKKAQMETVNALLQKGWAKKLPDGSFIRTYWPGETDINDPANIMLKNGVENGSIQQQPNGGYELVKEPTTPTVLDTDKPMPKLSSKK